MPIQTKPHAELGCLPSSVALSACSSINISLMKRTAAGKASANKHKHTAAPKTKKETKKNEKSLSPLHEPKEPLVTDEPNVTEVLSQVDTSSLEPREKLRLEYEEAAKVALSAGSMANLIPLLCSFKAKP